MPLELKAVNDLARHIEPLRQELQEAVREVIESGWLVLGAQVDAFERAFADYCGADGCVSMANGTDALQLALAALGVGAGDRVLTVANAGMYSSAAILAQGALPVFADIDPQSLLIDPAAVPPLVDAFRPAALVLTHLYGRMADVPRILDMARTLGLPVVEDCAQAHGAELAGRKSGAWGDLGCFSFYPTKNLGALGDGGAVVTSHPELVLRLRCLRQYGWTAKYRAEIPGGRNSRLDEIQAAVLLRMLPRLDGWNTRRREIATTYSATIRHPRVVSAPVGHGDYVAHLYVVRSPERDALRAYLAQAGIPSEIHYPIPDHRQTALTGRWVGAGLPHTELACTEVLTLPCFPEMTDEEVAWVAARVNDW